MLTRSEKGALIDALRADIEKAQGLFLTNVIGIASNDSTALRKSVRDASGKVVVTRNTLFSKASKGTAAEALLKDLKGPQALVIAFDNAPAVAKALKIASKGLDVVELRGGILDGKSLTPAEVMALADLPSLSEMLGTLLATFNAPISAFARVLNAIKEKKENEAGMSSAPAVAAEEVSVE